MCHTKNVFQGEVEEQETCGLYGIQTVSKSKSSGYTVSVKVNGHLVDMLVDIGAVVSVVPKNIYRNQVPLRKARDLRSYSGDKLNLLGELTVTVEYNDQKYELPLVIVKGDKPSLFGRKNKSCTVGLLFVNVGLY